MRFTVLDSWRGIAALIVAWGHIAGTAWFLDNAYHARSGWAVDFFFVLSGFVIAASYGERLSQGFPVARFMFLRFARLWPLHVAVIAVMVLMELVYWWLGSIDFLQGREPFGQGRELSRLPATIFLLQEYVHPGERPWSVASWSISVEIGLYMMAALLFRFAGRGAALLGLIIACVAGFLLFNPPLWDGATDIVRGLCGFGLGMALYSLWLRVEHISISPTLASLAEFAVLAAIILLISIAPIRVLGILLFAAAILIFAFERGLISALLRRRVFVFLGAISYSIYLVHGLVIGRSFDVLGLVQARMGWRIVTSGLGGADALLMDAWLSAAVTFGMLAGTCLASWITWRLIEEPARRWSKAKAKNWGAAEEQARAPWK